MSERNRTGCPVCSTEQGLAVYPIARDPITGDTFEVLKCPSCDLTYTASRPQNYDHYYPAGYRGYGSLVKWVLKRLYERRVTRWLRDRTGPGSVLEIGCGPGLILEIFRQNGWRALGTERNENAAAEARLIPGVEVTSTGVEGLPQKAQFDLIVMFQVLEHLEDPVSVLRDCAQRLSLDGQIIINVPNFASWQARFAGPFWLHLDVPRHVSHFTPHSLQSALQRADLRAHRISFISWEHDPYGWIESVMNRLTGRSNTLTRYLMGFDRLDARVVLAAVIGSALIVPAIAISLLSWWARRGALVEISAGKPTGNPARLSNPLL